MELTGDLLHGDTLDLAMSTSDLAMGSLVLASSDPQRRPARHEQEQPVKKPTVQRGEVGLAAVVLAPARASRLHARATTRWRAEANGCGGCFHPSHP